MVNPFSHAQFARELLLALDQPTGFKGGRQLGQAHMSRARKLPADLGKAVIRPNDLAGRCQRDHRRQRRMRHRRLDLAPLDHDIIHQLLYLPPLFLFPMQ